MLNIKQKILQASSLLGGYRLFRWLTRDTPKILMYHRFAEQPRSGYVHKEIFEQQVSYLRKYFNVIKRVIYVQTYIGCRTQYFVSA